MTTYSATNCKVMISSTTLDLPQHREAALDAIHRAHCVPVMMEHSTAESDSDAISFSLGKVEEAQIYVGIFGMRYGYIPEDRKRNPDGLSITELEYRHAKRTQKPVLIFIHHKTHVFSGDQIDDAPEPIAKRRKLHNDLLANEIVGFFKNPDDLGKLLIQALFEQKELLSTPSPMASPPLKSKPSAVAPPELWAVPPYTLTNKFIGRTPELDALDKWAASECPILIVEGIGGLGKSALTWEWVNERATQNIDNLQGRLWWSFYEKTSLKEFTRNALVYLTQKTLDEVGQDYKQNSRQLLIELNARPSLLVLDGFERILTAYHRWDKAQQRDDRIATHLRGCTDPADADLLKYLTHAGPSKILITSRLFPHALESLADQTPIPGVIHHRLDGLSESDTLHFFDHNHVRGDKQEMLRFAGRFGRHSLVLKIVCGMINRYRRRPGDFDSWLADPHHGGSLRLEDLELQQVKTHILAFALSGLEDEPRKLLHRIAVLSEDVDYDTVSAINPFIPEQMEEPTHIKDSIRWNYLWSDDYKRQAIPDYEKQYDDSLRTYQQYQKVLSESTPNLDRALEELDERGLLQWDRDTNRYNMHPVVRGYASDRIESDERKLALKVARDHFGAMPEDDFENATELEHISTSMNIYSCLLGEGLHNQAVDFFRQKLMDPIFDRMAAYAVVVEQLEPFFRGDLGTKPELASSRDQGWLLDTLPVAYLMIGRLELASGMIKRALKLNIQEEYWMNVSRNLATLVNIYNARYSYAEASAAVRLRLTLSEALDNKEDLANVALFQGGVSIRQGRFEEGENILRQHTEDSPNRTFWLWASQFYQGKSTHDEWSKGYRSAKEQRSIRNQIYFLSLYAMGQLELGLPFKALNFVDEALHLGNKTGIVQPGNHAVRAWALACLDRREDATRELLFLDSREEGYSAAQAWLALGDRDRAVETALEGYRRAWGSGPPHIEWFTLDRTRSFLEQMGATIPELPPFDPAKVTPIPYEEEILEGIERIKAAARAHRERLRRLRSRTSEAPGSLPPTDNNREGATELADAAKESREAETDPS